MKRPIRVECDVAYVPLTRGLEAMIDAADVPIVDGRNWCALKARHTFYAFSNFVRPDGIRTTIYMHRLLLNSPLIVDHKDGNGINNKRDNIRPATYQQNAFNRGPQSNNSSGFKGVSFHPQSGRWRASIRIDGRRLSLGLYATAEDAAHRHNEACHKFHGEFACGTVAMPWSQQDRG